MNLHQSLSQTFWDFSNSALDDQNSDRCSRETIENVPPTNFHSIDDPLPSKDLLKRQSRLASRQDLDFLLQDVLREAENLHDPKLGIDDTHRLNSTDMYLRELGRQQHGGGGPLLTDFPAVCSSPTCGTFHHKCQQLDLGESHELPRIHGHTAETGQNESPHGSQSFTGSDSCSETTSDIESQTSQGIEVTLQDQKQQSSPKPTVSPSARVAVMGASLHDPSRLSLIDEMADIVSTYRL
eukprot:GHVN01014392.1.p1 GENE.GHVN01014392.1~~GHVN01014392.1.p1  ORF type:complete len:239 (+),score=27.61 GHVN01014392.1:871-1587(+)